jgi:hypothetical protein
MAKRGNPSLRHRISIAGEISPSGYCLKGNPNPVTFTEGNLYSCKENMSEEANRKRMRGLAKCWTIKARKKRGERIISYYGKKSREMRHRIRLRENMVKEAREIQELAKGFTGSAMKRVFDIINDEHARNADVIAAAQFLHDRAYGKATQTSISAKVDANGKSADIGAKELDTRIKQALARVERITGGAPEEGKGEERPADVRISDRDSGGSSVH